MNSECVPQIMQARLIPSVLPANAGMLTQPQERVFDVRALYGITVSICEKGFRSVAMEPFCSAIHVVVGKNSTQLGIHRDVARLVELRQPNRE
jgi:hypothetical protein